MTSKLPPARFDVRVIARRGARSVTRINAAWLALATRHQLFGDTRWGWEYEDGEFFLSTPGDDEPHWLRVRLSEPWDLAGWGAATGLLGSGAGQPEFAMLAPAGTMALRVTTSEDRVELWALPYPNAELYRIDLADGAVDSGPPTS